MRRDVVRWFIAGMGGSWLIVLAMLLLCQSLQTPEFNSACYVAAAAVLIIFRRFRRNRRVVDESLHFRSRELRCCPQPPACRPTTPSLAPAVSSQDL